MPNQRQHLRTPLRCRIRIVLPDIGEATAETRDVSDGGVYIRHDTLGGLPVGSRIHGQIMDLPSEPPVMEMEVMWTDGHGAGLRFLLDDKAL